MSMDAPTWDVIAHSLKIVLSKYDVDLSSIGLAQRIDYKDFEHIFYHLFLIIEPAETKRRFWSIYPSRNPDERTRFVETSLQMINIKQMSPYRASLAQLKMLGGDPFRRLLGSLIEKAAGCKIQSVQKKYPACNIAAETDIDCNSKRLEQLQKQIEDRLPDLRNTLSRYRPLQETLASIDIEIIENLEILNAKAFRELNNLDNDNNYIREIFKSILARWEKASSRQNMTIPKNTSRRVSEHFKKMREFLAMSPDCDVGTSKSKTLKKVSEQLLNYDEGVESLVTIWEDEQERSEAALAEIPEMRQRYEFFETLIPQLKFSLISLDIGGN